MATLDALKSELLTAVVRELRNLWLNLNWSHFSNRLRPPAFELTTSTSFLGRWCPETRTIQLSEQLIENQPWDVIEGVLKHEMAHQFAQEALGAEEETSHGPTFRSVCERLGIDPAASGLPQAADLDERDTRVLERISRLLSLAGSSNQHEAEAATIAARRLMLKHNVEGVSAGSRYGYKRLGKPSGRIDEGARVLARILSDHFMVEPIWIRVYLPQEDKHASMLEIVGTPANLAIAEYVHLFLLRTADELWTAHRATAERSRRHDKTVFRTGVMHGFRDKLNADRKRTTESGLVWIKDGQLDLYFKKRHPRVKSFSRAGVQRNAAFEDGRAKGRQIVLRRGMEQAAPSRGLALGDGRSK